MERCTEGGGGETQNLRRPPPRSPALQVEGERAWVKECQWSLETEDKLRQRAQQGNRDLSPTITRNSILLKARMSLKTGLPQGQHLGFSLMR